MRIIVIGAGIGGLAAALTLGRCGFEVQVFEQASELREVGAGVQISPNATRILHRLGLEEPLRSSECCRGQSSSAAGTTGALSLTNLWRAPASVTSAPRTITSIAPNCSTFFPRQCRAACFILTIDASD
jgi:2-polyprenyl-6-methoxyphenol hydroxylase-like FAD-dependent oxidoreductase